MEIFKKFIKIKKFEIIFNFSAYGRSPEGRQFYYSCLNASIGFNDAARFAG